MHTLLILIGAEDTNYIFTIDSFMGTIFYLLFMVSSN